MFCAIVLAWLYTALEYRVSLRRLPNGIMLVVPEGHMYLDQKIRPEEMERILGDVEKKSALWRFAFAGFEYMDGGTPNAPLYQWRHSGR